MRELHEQNRMLGLRGVRLSDDVAGKQPRDSDGDLPETLAETSPFLSQVRDAYLRSDARAGRLQNEVNQTFNAVLLAGIAFSLFISIASVWSDNKTFLVISWGMLLLAWAFVQQEKRGRRGRRANRQQDYRSLAEAWRVAFFWRAMGIEDPLDVCYLRSQRGELDWIRQAIRTGDLEWRAASGYPQSSAKAFEQAFDKWITSQTKYFKKKVPHDRVFLTSLRNWSWALVVFGLVAKAVEVFVQLQADGMAGSPPVWRFVLDFASAEVLTSPLVPAVLSLVHMSSWPVATKENTAVVSNSSSKEQDVRKQLRHWFVLESARWRLVAVFGGLALGGVVTAVYVGHLSSAQLVPFLQVVGTVAFFLPAIIFAFAEFKALPEHVRLYERMSRVFALAEKLLREVKGQSNWGDEKVQDKARRIYCELGREALHENGEWLLIHRDRPLDIEA